MLYPIAIERGSDSTAFGVVVPDIEGCFSAGDTLDKALVNVREAIDLQLTVMAEQGDLPPEGTPIEQLVDHPDYHAWVWMVIDVDIEPYMGRSAKINVTLPTLLTKKIDHLVETNSAYQSRSHFLQVASTRELSRQQGQ